MARLGFQVGPFLLLTEFVGKIALFGQRGGFVLFLAGTFAAAQRAAAALRFSPSLSPASYRGRTMPARGFHRPRSKSSQTSPLAENVSGVYPERMPILANGALGFRESRCPEGAISGRRCCLRPSPLGRDGRVQQPPKIRETFAVPTGGGEKRLERGKTTDTFAAETVLQA